MSSDQKYKEKTLLAEPEQADVSHETLAWSVGSDPGFDCPSTRSRSNQLEQFDRLSFGQLPRGPTLARSKSLPPIARAHSGPHVEGVRPVWSFTACREPASNAGRHTWSPETSERETGEAVMIDNNPELTDLMRAHGFVDANGVVEAHFPAYWRDPFCFNDFRPRTLKRALPRLAVAFLIWNIGLYANTVSQAWLQHKMPRWYQARWAPIPPLENATTVLHGKVVNNSVILYDAGYEWLHPLLSTRWAEYIAGGLPTFVFLRFIAVPGPFSMRWTISTRICLIWGLLWGLRAFTIVSTVLPNPDLTCKPKITFKDNVFIEALANMPLLGWKYHETTCQDVLFSGHTVAITLAVCFAVRYIKWAPAWPCAASSSLTSGANVVKLALIVSCFLGYYCIIASRFHYTVDVMVACMLTLLLFQGYHSLVRVAFLPAAHPQGCKCGLYAFLRWFDKYAIDVEVLRLVLLRKPAYEPSINPDSYTDRGRL